MVQFLSWLWSVAEKQFSWFGPDFWAVATKIRNVAFLIFQMVQQAITPVYGSISQGLSDIWYRTTGFVGGVQVTLTNYTNNLHGVAINELNMLGVRFQQNLNAGMNFVQALIKAAVDTFQAIINSWIGLTQVMIADVARQWAAYQSMIGPRIEMLINTAILPIRSWVTSTLAGWTVGLQQLESNLQSLRLSIAFYTGTAKVVIVSFLQDPVKFVLALLIPRILDVLFQLLAEGLGAENDVIPPRPDWSDPRAYSEDSSASHEPIFDASHQPITAEVTTESRA